MTQRPEMPARAIVAVAESTVMNLHAFLQDAFTQEAPDVRWLEPGQVEDPASVDVAVCWYAAPGALQRYTGLQLVQSLAAGPDHLFPAIEGLRADLPLCRIVDPLMSHAMAGYVAWAVLNQHRQFRIYTAQQERTAWARQPVKPASAHCVGIAGLGQLGLAATKALLALGYGVRGWTRSAREEPLPHVDIYTGPQQLDAFLTGCDTLVCLLPLTAQTRGFIGQRVLNQLPSHAHVINVSRGEHVDDDALLAALDAGRIAHATLDAFAHEPLPPQHRFWSHPRITITPHVGARTPNTQVVHQMLVNLEAARTGQRRDTWVDRQRGY